MTFMHRRLLIAILFTFAPIFAAHAQNGPKNSVVLIIRHAEDADSGDGISAVGEKRAEAYQNYFQNLPSIRSGWNPKQFLLPKTQRKATGRV